MATNHAQAANGGFTEYGIHFRALTLRDYAELDVWMQDRYRKHAIRSAMESGLSGEMLRQYFISMHEYVSRLTTASEFGEDQLRSIDGAEEVLRRASDGAFSPEALRAKLGGPGHDIEKRYMDAVTSLLMRVKMLAIGADVEAELKEGEGDSVDPT